MKLFNIKNEKLYYGGAYCMSLNEQARILQDFVKKAKKYKTIIQKYTDDSYYNQYLRGQAELLEENYEDAAQVIETLFTLFDEIQPYTPKGFTYLYRGVDKNCDIAVNDLGFMSTSTDINVAKYFGDNIVRIVLMNPFKYHILPLEKVTSCKNEYEVLLAPGRGKFILCDDNQFYKQQKMCTYIYVPHSESPINMKDLCARYHILKEDKVSLSSKVIKLFKKLKD